MALHIKTIKPMHNYLVVTGERYTEDMKSDGIIVANAGDLKLYQKVIAVGPVVRGIKEGDTVMMSLLRYGKRKYSKDSVQNDMDNNPVIKWELPWIQVDDEDGNPQDCLLIADSDVKFAFVGYESNEPIILTESPQLILN